MSFSGLDAHTYTCPVVDPALALVPLALQILQENMTQDTDGAAASLKIPERQASGRTLGWQETLTHKTYSETKAESNETLRSSSKRPWHTRPPWGRSLPCPSREKAGQPAPGNFGCSGHRKRQGWPTCWQRSRLHRLP